MGARTVRTASDVEDSSFCLPKQRQKHLGRPVELMVGSHQRPSICSTGVSVGGSMSIYCADVSVLGRTWWIVRDSGRELMKSHMSDSLFYRFMRRS